MSYIKTPGIVIRQSDTGEADRVLTVLTETEGKIQVWAKGARRPRSKLLASSQLFCASNFIFFKTKNSWQVNSSEVIETFFNLRKDIEKLTYAAHIVNLVNDIIQEDQKSSGTLRLLLNTLHFISNTERNPELMVHIFELRIMVLAGFMPGIHICHSCGASPVELVKSGVADFYFNMDKGKLICGNCGAPAKDLTPLSSGAAMAVCHIVSAPLEKVFSFNVDDAVLKELASFCRSYIAKHLEKDYKGLDFLKEL